MHNFQGFKVGSVLTRSWLSHAITCFYLELLQIRLPQSAGDALMAQGAPKNGAMLFKLATSAGRSVHAGVLDFSAAQGTVAVPEHLIRNMWGLTTCDGKCHGHVTVTYKKLPKGTAIFSAACPPFCLQPDTTCLLCCTWLHTG